MKVQFSKKDIWYWAPRILAIGIILFIGLFALDVFDSTKPLLSQLGAFLIHLVPNYLLLAALLLAWKKEKLGGIVFLGIGLVFIFFFKTYRDAVTFFLISFPIILIGIGFLYHYFLAKKYPKKK